MKKMQYIHMFILTILFITIISCFYLTIISFSKMINLSKESNIIVINLPKLTENKQLYNNDDYKKVLNMIDLSIPNVTIEIKNNSITILSPGIENEVNIRQTMSAILALDRNLYIESICGNINNNCNGNAFEIIIKGEKKNIILSN